MTHLKNSTQDTAMGTVKKEIPLAPAIDQSRRSSPATIRAWETLGVIP
jgi:hypothetical protein